MTRDRYQRLRELFHALCELGETERAAFLNRACGDEAGLCAELEALVALDGDETDAFGEGNLGVGRNLRDGQVSGEFPLGGSKWTHTTLEHLGHSAENTVGISFHERFFPGSVLAGRYRIVSFLGRGGMGEVYRADDLKLGQPAALKFLSEELESLASFLERFHNEVRNARLVSHPNVCRVHDIVEGDGKHFITMEHVDGEDLGSLLRRVGRLSQDKAAQIAQELCAGLVAAHERGVLHCDIKPANIMIDGRGHVRITDFGLAGIAHEFEGSHIGAGTPPYMAPELHAGMAATAQSDLYALGLVLNELFTGWGPEYTRERAMRSAEYGDTPGAFWGDLPNAPDSSVERVILRCLQPDPHQRPASVSAVAAALPGVDPLNAILSAGQTPSPEMIAAAGGRGALHPMVAAACFGGVLLGLLLLIPVKNSATLVNRTVLDLPPEALAVKASEIVESIGYDESPKDTDYGFEVNNKYLRFVQQRSISIGRPKVLTVEPSAGMYFWYRQSPHYMIATGFRKVGFSVPQYQRVSQTDPPMTVAGMIRLRLDPRGRLIAFYAVPPEAVSAETTSALTQATDASLAFDWPLLFEVAGLDFNSFTPTDAAKAPPVAFDSQMAWTGTRPNNLSTAIWVEAATYRRRPVYFQVLEPWDRAEHTPDTARSAPIEYVMAAIVVAAMAGALWLAPRNLRLGRADRRGAFRLAACMFTLHLLVWLFLANHLPTPGELDIVAMGGAFALWSGVSCWLFYIALEPYARRFWPGALISWSRLLDGRLRDPLVGRDILLGVLSSVIGSILFCLAFQLPAWLGSAPATPVLHLLEPLLGAGPAFGALVATLFMGVLGGLRSFLILLLLRVVLRSEWIAAGVWIVAFTMVFTTHFALSGGARAVSWLILAVWLSGCFILAIRFGLLLHLISVFIFWLLTFPITLDVSAWYASSGLLAVVLVAAIAAYGFHTARAGRGLLTL